MSKGKTFHQRAKDWVEATYPGSRVICTNARKSTVCGAFVLDATKPNHRTNLELRVP